MREPIIAVQCEFPVRQPSKFRVFLANTKKKLAGNLLGYCLEEGMMTTAKKYAGSLGKETVDDTAWRVIVSCTKFPNTKRLLNAMHVAKEFSIPPCDTLRLALLGAIRLACGRNHTTGTANLMELAELKFTILPKIGSAAIDYGWKTELKTVAEEFDTSSLQMVAADTRAASMIARWGREL
jgi:hypothetical protein